MMPDPVLGGATLLMFGTVAAAGIRIIAAQDINRKATLVLAVSLSLGLGVELLPDILTDPPVQPKMPPLKAFGSESAANSEQTSN